MYILYTHTTWGVYVCVWGGGGGGGGGGCMCVCCDSGVNMGWCGR